MKFMAKLYAEYCSKLWGDLWSLLLIHSNI